MRKYEMVEYTDGPRMAQREEGEYVLYDDAKAKIARLAAERDDAIKALSEAAKARGQAEGKLAASEMAGVVEGWKTRAEKAESERDQTLARAAAAAMEMRERAAGVLDEIRTIISNGDLTQGVRLDMIDKLAIRALPIDPDAQKALDKLLAKAREDAIREAATACDWGDIYGDNAVRTILALLTDGGRDE